jgi:chorismate-pyruvate lyase
MHENSSLVDNPAELQAAAETSLLYPLNEFYRESGLALPAVVRIGGTQMPEPYRSLLAHEHDMTPTLEAAYGRRMNLRVLKYVLHGDVFSRLIVLIPEDRTAPVVFGAIKIYLEHFSAEARRLVLERRLPFGTILQSQGMEHFGHPDAYLKVTPDALIQGALQIADRCQLYARRNALWGSGGRKLAQVLEILPPANDNSLLERINGAE